MQLTDAVVLLERLFAGRAFTPPPAACWLDFTEDALECAETGPCR